MKALFVISDEEKKFFLVNFLEVNRWTIAGKEMEDSLGTIEEELEQLDISTGGKA